MKKPSVSRNGVGLETLTGPVPPPRRIFTSGELFDSARMIVIRHAGEEYRLQITGKNKLILTK
jgi:hemin uptake protein HemP